MKIISLLRYITNMIAIITGDIIHSKRHQPDQWLEVLKKLFSSSKDMVEDFEIYRGDEFQLELTKIEDAFLMAIKIKAHIKSISTLDVRISIGLGNKSYKGKKITESNGSAYANSGEQLEGMKKQKINLAVKSDYPLLDKELNMMLKLGGVIWDNWSQVSAELAALMLDNPTQVQEKIANQLGIKQAAVSQRYKRSELALVKELEEYYRNRIISFQNK